MDDGRVVGFWRNLLVDAARAQSVEVDPDMAANLIAYILVFLSLRVWNLKNRNKEEVLAFVKGFVLKGLGIASGKGTDNCQEG